tara:strand:- start:83 stop:364 length:282 start_codon:yes stop_codon:yes gene_type:complete
MKITKELKHATFEYDEEAKEFNILTKPFGESTTGRNSISLNKIYAFAFTRFVVRISQRNWLRNSPKKQKEQKERIELAEHPFEDPDQTEFIFE